MIAGCAGFVRAVVRDSALAGNGLATFGKSIGDVKRGHLSCEIDARLSSTSC